MCTYRKDTLAITPAQENQLNYGDQTTRTAPRRLSQAPMRTLFGAGITWNVTGAPEQPPVVDGASAAGTRSATGRSSPIGNDRPARTALPPVNTGPSGRALLNRHTQQVRRGKKRRERKQAVLADIERVMTASGSSGQAIST